MSEECKWLVVTYIPTRGKKNNGKCFDCSVWAVNHDEAVSKAIEAHPEYKNYTLATFDPLLDTWVDVCKDDYDWGDESEIFSVYKYIGDRRAALRKKVAESLKEYKRPESKLDYESLPESLKKQIAINKKTGCWIWRGAAHRNGYGHLTVDGKKWFAHRYLYTLAFGEIPENGVLLHSCDIRLCVCPNHLKVGSVYDNNADTGQKGKSKIGKAGKWDDFTIDAGPKPLGGLSNDRQLAVRQLYYDTKWTQKKIAGLYGIDRKVAKRIIDGYMTFEDIREIRARYHSGGVTMKVLEDEYQVHKDVIRGLISFQKFETRDEFNKKWACKM